MADEFRSLGHCVEKFDLDDAVPRRGLISRYLGHWQFARQAVRHVQRVGRTYDVILAAQADLPVARARLKFDGVLTTRSDGLVHFYTAYERDEAQKARQGGRPRKRLGRLARWVASWVWDEERAAERTFVNADLITLLNDDEFRLIDRLPGRFGLKAIVLPNGLSAERRVALAEAARGPGERVAAKRVGFVGAWGERKGKTDFPVIVRDLRAVEPGVSVRLLGTGIPADVVRNAFDSADRTAVEVIPNFAPDELPSLLADVTVGLLPSYIEGFPMAVLEMLASRLPVVAYDVPGPRVMLRDWPTPLLVPPGDTAEAASRLADLLAAAPHRYSELADHARRVSDQFCWPDIAQTLLNKWADLLS